MAVSIAELQAVITADTGDFDAKMASAGKTVEEVGAKGAAASADFGKAGLAMGGAGAAIGAGLVGAVQAAGDFQSSMNEIGSVTGATAEQMTQLSDLALQVGQDTAFSAQQGAQAISELGKAGVPIPDILSGAAMATADLAAAAGVDMPRAAEIMSNAMNVFQIAGSDASQVADTLAAGANTSSASINDLAMGMAQVGPSAIGLGLSLQETSAALALFADRGLSGSDAGTSLKTMLASLTPSTIPAKNAFKELGLSTDEVANAFFDANGEFVGMEQASNLLYDALAPLTDLQRAQALETIFGSDASRAAELMFQAQKSAVEGAGRGYESYLAAVMPAGQATEVANAKMAGMNGAIEALKGSIETAAIVLGMAFVPAIEQAADVLSTLVNAFLQLPEPVQSGIAVAAALAAGFLALGGAVAGVVAVAGTLGPVLAGIVAVATPLAAVLAAVGLAVVAYQQNWFGFGDAVNGVVDKVRLAVNVFNALKGVLGPGEAALQALELAFPAVGQAARRVADTIGQMGVDFAYLRDNGLNPAQAGFAAVAIALENLTGLPVATWAKGILDAFDAVGPVVTALAQNLVQTVGNVGGALRDALGALLDGDFETAFRKVFDALGSALSGFLTSLGILKDALWQAFQAVDWGAVGQAISDGLAAALQAAADLGGRLLQWAADAVASVDWGAIWNGLGDLAGIFVQRLGDLASALVGWVTGAVSAIDWTAVWGTVGDVTQTVVAALGDLASALFGWVSGAVSAIDWTGVWATVGDVTATIVAALGDLATALRTWISTAVAGIDWQAVWTTVGDVTATIVAALGDLTSALFGWVSGAVGAIDWTAVWGAVGDVTATVVAKLGDLASALVGWVTGAVSAIDWTGVWATVADVTATIVGKLGDLAAALAGWVADAAAAMDWRAIVTAAESAWADVQAAVSGAWAAIGSLISTGADAAKAVVSGAWDAVTSATEGAWSEVQSAVSGAWSAIQSVVSTTAEAIKAVVGNAWSDVQTAVTQALSAIQSEVSGAWAAIQSVVSTTVEGIKATVTTAWNDVTAAIDTAMADAQTAVNTGWQAIQTAVGAFLETIKATVRTKFDEAKQAMADSLANAKSEAEAKVAEIASAITSALASLPGQMLEIGKQIGQGLIDGLGAMVQGVKDAAGNLAGAAAGAVTGVLGISSPSKVMHRYGEWVAEGLANGMLDKAGLTEAGGRALAEAAIGGTKDAAGMGGPSTVAAQMGHDFVQGFLEGLEARRADVVALLRSLAEEAVGALATGLADAGPAVEAAAAATDALGDALSGVALHASGTKEALAQLPPELQAGAREAAVMTAALRDQMVAAGASKQELADLAAYLNEVAASGNSANNLLYALDEQWRKQAAVLGDAVAALASTASALDDVAAEATKTAVAVGDVAPAAEKTATSIGGIEPVAEATADAMADAAGSIQADLAATAEAATDSASITERVWAQISDVFERVGLDAKAATDRIAAGTKNAATAATGAAQIIDRVWSEITKTFDKVGLSGEGNGKKAGEGLVKGIADKAKDVADATAKAVDDSVRAATESAKKATAAGAAFGEAMTDGLGRAGGAFLDRVEKLLDTAADAKEAGFAGREVGLAFAQGMADGLRDGLDEVADAAAELGKEAERAARKATKSESPSRVAMAVGLDFGAGFADGLAQAQDAAADAALLLALAAEQGMTVRQYLAWRAGLAFGERVAAGIVAGVPAIHAGMQVLVRGVEDAVRDVLPAAKLLGAEWGHNYWMGILSQGTKTAQAAAWVAQQAMNAATGAAGKFAAQGMGITLQIGFKQDEADALRQQIDDILARAASAGATVDVSQLEQAHAEMLQSVQAMKQEYTAAMVGMTEAMAAETTAQIGTAQAAAAQVAAEWEKALAKAEKAVAQATDKASKQAAKDNLAAVQEQAAAATKLADGEIQKQQEKLSLIGQLQQAYKDLGAATTEAGQEIAQLQIDYLTQQLAELEQVNLAETLGVQFESVSAALEAAAASIQQSAQLIKDALAAAAAAEAPEAGAGGGGKVKGESGGGKIKDELNETAAAADRLGPALGRAGAAFPVFSGLAGGAMDAVRGSMDVGGRAVEDLSGRTIRSLDAIGPALTAVPPQVGDMVGKSEGELKKLPVTGELVTTKMVDGMKTTLHEEGPGWVLDVERTVIDATVNGERVADSGGMEIGRTIMISATEGTAQEIDRSGRGVSNAVNGVVRHASDHAKQPANQAGKDVGGLFGDGIADGINSKQGPVGNAAQQIVNAALQAAKAAAQIHSPSRAAMAVGELWAAGLAAGIRAGTRDVAEAAAGLLDAPNATRPAGPGGPRAGGRGGGGGRGDGGGATVVYNLTGDLHFPSAREFEAVIERRARMSGVSAGRGS